MDCETAHARSEALATSAVRILRFSTLAMNSILEPDP